MALSNLYNLIQHLGISGQDALLGQILDVADRAIKNYLGRGRGQQSFAQWPESTTDTQYMTGTGTDRLMLRYTPVSAITSLYLDIGGLFGDGTGAFAVGTLLVAGTDYVLQRDDGTWSSSGIVRLLGSTTGGNYADYSWFPSTSGALSGQLTLAAGRLGPVWPMNPGCIKITYTAGYSAGSIPADLVHATNLLASWLYATRNAGMTTTTEKLGSYSITYATKVLNTHPDLGSIRQLLARYREISL